MVADILIEERTSTLLYLT